MNIFFIFMNAPDLKLKREELEQLVVQLILDRVLVRITDPVDHESRKSDLPHH